MLRRKACPFCGSEDDDLIVIEYASDIYVVHCYGCRAESGNYETAEEAIKAWNKRVFKCKIDETK